MENHKYNGIMQLLTEIRDRLPAPGATPTVSLTGVVTLPEEPPIGTILRDYEGETWERFSGGWVVNDSGRLDRWQSVLAYAPLTIVSASDQSAAKSTDAILADLRAMVNDWKESSNITVRDCARDVLDILDGK